MIEVQKHACECQIPKPGQWVPLRREWDLWGILGDSIFIKIFLKTNKHTRSKCGRVLSYDRFGR